MTKLLNIFWAMELAAQTSWDKVIRTTLIRVLLYFYFIYLFANIYTSIHRDGNFLIRYTIILISCLDSLIIIKESKY